jgi:hypothetical protein
MIKMRKKRIYCVQGREYKAEIEKQTGRMIDQRTVLFGKKKILRKRNHVKSK